MDQLDTPALVVDVERLEQNIRRWQAYCDQHGIRNRPHAKTHKSVSIARRQLEAGAVGLTCQKLSEAEVLSESGASEILIPYNILGATKLERLKRLLERLSITVTADSALLLPGLTDAARTAAIRLGVMVECDAGLGRAGVASAEEAAELAHAISKRDELRFAGLLSHPVLETTIPLLSAAADRIRRRGIEVPSVSVGGTRTMWRAHELLPTITEYRAGAYVFNDRSVISAGAATLDNIALTIVATVVSRPTRSRVVVDAGSKTLSSDPGPDGRLGLILNEEDAVIERLDEEHMIVAVSSNSKLAPGSRVSIVPNHVCGTVALADTLWVTRGGMVSGQWRVDARGSTT